MEITYSTTKNDVMNYYIKRWKEKLWKQHIFILACSIFVVYNQLARTQYSGFLKLAISLSVGCLILALMPLIPMLLHENQERTLAITNEGLKTSIGKKQIKIPWSKVAIVEKTQSHIYITGKNQNGFVIPNTAFKDLGHKDLFFNKIKENAG